DRIYHLQLSLCSQVRLKMCDESESKSKFLAEKKSLKIAEERFNDIKDLKDLEDLRTKGLNVIEYSRNFLKEIEDLILLNGSRSKKLLNENINIDDKVSKNGKDVNKDCKYRPNEFQTFIDESINFKNIKNKLFEFDLYIYYTIKEDYLTKDRMVINDKEIIRLMNEIKSMIDEFKNSIKEWRVEVKPKNLWKKFRNKAMCLTSFLQIPQQKYDFKITEGELSGGRLVRGSNEHIVQRNYREQKVAEKTTDKPLHELKKEIYFMRNLRECSNILEFHGYCRRSNDLSVISEWADYNLQTYLNDHVLNPSEKLSIARGIASALDFCHEKKILHHDIRTFALVMWAILYQQMPFITLTSKEEIRRQILDKNRPELATVDGILVEYQKIIEKSWSHEPSARQNMKTILEHLNRLDLENFSDFSDQDADDYFDFNSTNIDPTTATILKSKEFEMCHRYSQYPSKSKEIEQGIEYHKDKKYEDSWNIFKEYCHLKPKDPHANFWVGFYYLKGHYVKKDIQEGLKYLKKASELQHPDAQYWYSLTLLNNSIEFENDGYETAMKYLRISALTNYKALEVLGRIVQTGIYGRKANYLVGKAMIDEAQNMKMINKKFSTT
ncbi:40275_t:CDS:2, partial [Gigaspora margarita]